MLPLESAEPRDAHPSLDRFRQPLDGKCSWCGAAATTREHRFKHSDLRRVATGSGVRDLGALFKKSDFYEGPLRTLKRGDEVQWGVNLCAPCNNARSQPFDMAYDQFVNNRPIPPCRSRSRSSMLSAPATIPATTAATLTAAFGDGTVNDSAAGSESPQRRIEPSTGTRPADDTRFGSSNATDVAETV